MTLANPSWSPFALAFRGYNTTNLGRTAELLACPAYAPLLQRRLDEAAAICSEVLQRRVDLVKRVETGSEASLAEYAESVALVFAIELAQIDMLAEVHGVEPADASLSFGYSLGELVALAASGVLRAEQAMHVPLAMATDSAKLAKDITMGVLFSRALPIEEHLVDKLCDEICLAGEVIGVSAVLSPNSLLLLGQGSAMERFRGELAEAFPDRVHLRLNDSRWPPLHTPIVRQQWIPDRASVMIQRMSITGDAAAPPVVSLVTGKPAPKNSVALRELLRDWVDHRQRLWDVVCCVLHSPVRMVVHVGPEPNVIPATFTRLAENIRQLQARGNLSGFGARALGQIVARSWLSARIPTSAALLRAPHIKQVILEDWLLENAPN